MFGPGIRIRSVRVPARLLALIVVSASGAASPSDGNAQELRGRVARPDSTAVVGVAVELHRVSEESGALVDSTVTDASGRFTFVLAPDADPATIFLAGARHDGVLYWGPPVHASDPGMEPYAVVVFDTAMVSGPADDLRSSIRHVVITPSAVGLAVEEIIDVEGRRGRTLVGATDSATVWSAALARDAHGIVPSAGGVPPEDLALLDGGVGFRGALPPSGIRVAVQYVVPSSEYVLDLDTPTGRLELLVMPRPGLELRVTGLDEAPVGSDMRVPVRRFTGTDLPAGASLSVAVSIQPAGKNRAGIWLIISLALGAAALVSVRLNAGRRSSGG